jgi:uncharacterized protein (DUF2267 family)
MRAVTGPSTIGRYVCARDPGANLMTITRVDIIDRSVEKAHVWINDMAGELGTDDGRQAFRVLRAFLHAVRDHLSVDEAAQLSAQLPIFVRGVFYESWDPSRTPDHARGLDSFLTKVAGEAGLAGETEASFAAAAASRVLCQHVSPGEADSVLRALPQHIRELLNPQDS